MWIVIVAFVSIVIWSVLSQEIIKSSEENKENNKRRIILLLQQVSYQQ
ncbi:hypothetical protein [Paenibacillus xylanilyticus]|nr:hypothetical protein [Paenibacillus xylanilyticus]